VTCRVWRRVLWRVAGQPASRCALLVGHRRSVDASSRVLFEGSSSERRWIYSRLCDAVIRSQRVGTSSEVVQVLPMLREYSRHSLDWCSAVFVLTARKRKGKCNERTMNGRQQGAPPCRSQARSSLTIAQTLNCRVTKASRR
jgi:hypothetical protein